MSHRVNDESSRKSRRAKTPDSSESTGSWESLEAPETVRYPKPRSERPEPAYERPEPAYGRPEPAYGRPEPAFAPVPDDDDEPVGRFAKKPKKKQPFWKEVLIIAVVAVVLTTVIQTFIGRVFVIPSASMEPTLHGCTGCNNDRVLVDKVTYLFGDPQPGDVVVFRGPPNWTQGKQPPDFLTGTVQDLGSLVGLSEPSGTDFVKRVIAVGGQTVECCDDQGRVLVDGKPLDEPYLNLTAGQKQEPFEKVTVPAGRLWVMGDNRNNSADSRKHGDPTPADGAIPVDNVIGKARLIVLSRWTGVTTYNPQGD